MVSSNVSEENCKPWLFKLLTGRFFQPCHSHSSAKKTPCNYFCLECEKACCKSDCESNHKKLQIRRYVLHEVILVEDAVKLIDPSECPTYTINGYQAVFINQREHNGRSASKQRQESSCLTCSRVLEGTVKFCSLCCKVEHYINSGLHLETILRDWTCFETISKDRATPKKVAKTERNHMKKKGPSKRCQKGGESKRQCNQGTEETLSELSPPKRRRTETFVYSNLNLRPNGEYEEILVAA